MSLEVGGHEGIFTSGSPARSRVVRIPPLADRQRQVLKTNPSAPSCRCSSNTYAENSILFGERTLREKGVRVQKWGGLEFPDEALM